MIKAVAELAPQHGIQMDPIDADMVLKAAQVFSGGAGVPRHAGLLRSVAC